MAKGKLFVITLTGTLSECEPGLWRACSDQWKVVAYGKTKLEADLRLDYGTSMLARAIASRSSIRAFTTELRRAGAKFKQYPLDDTAPTPDDGAKYTSNELEEPDMFNFERQTTLLAGAGV